VAQKLDYWPPLIKKLPNSLIHLLTLSNNTAAHVMCAGIFHDDHHNFQENNEDCLAVGVVASNSSGCFLTHGLSANKYEYMYFTCCKKVN